MNVEKDRESTICSDGDVGSLGLATESWTVFVHSRAGVAIARAARSSNGSSQRCDSLDCRPATVRSAYGALTSSRRVDR